MANLKERNIALVSKDSDGVTTIDYPLTSAEMVEGLEEFVKTHSTPLTLPLPLNNGGTGATTAANARANLGLGNVAVENILPITKGGTGATNVAAAVKALLGSSAIGSSTKPLYYDGAALKACADSIGGGGIVAQLLEQNGYVKFANGLILQWGYATIKSAKITFPISYTNKLFGIYSQLVADGTTTIVISITKETLTGFTFSTNTPQSQFQSFRQHYWLSVGM